MTDALSPAVERALCAHLRVWYRTEIEFGLTRGWWECFDCRARFIPEAAILADRDAAVRAETERCAGIADAERNRWPPDWGHHPAQMIAADIATAIRGEVP